MEQTESGTWISTCETCERTYERTTGAAAHSLAVGCAKRDQGSAR